MGRSTLEHLPLDLMVQELISVRMTFEIDNALFWMYRFLIPLPLLINSPFWLLLISAMKRKRKELTEKESGRWNMGLSLHWSSQFWGMAKETTIFYKLLASLLPEKWTQHNPTIISWLRCIISFSLIWLSIHCLWGAQSARGHPVGPIHCAIDLVRLETHFAVSSFLLELFSQCLLSFFSSKLSSFHCIVLRSIMLLLIT